MQQIVWKLIRFWLVEIFNKFVMVLSQEIEEANVFQRQLGGCISETTSYFLLDFSLLERIICSIVFWFQVLFWRTILSLLRFMNGCTIWAIVFYKKLLIMSFMQAKTFWKACLSSMKTIERTIYVEGDFKIETILLYAVWPNFGCNNCPQIVFHRFIRSLHCCTNI